MVDEITEEKAAEQAEETAAPSAKKGKKKLGILIGVVAVIVVLGVGMWIWHEQPGFCSAVCHGPMNDYVVTYEEPANAAGTDKWGNNVSNTNAMLSVSHREHGKNCLACHVPTIGQQLGEVGAFVSGDYLMPLNEVNTEQLQVNSGHAEGSGDEFCLKSGCHVNSDGSVMTREDLKKLTSDRAFNPHDNKHGKQDCGDCHKSHRASVYQCTKCHNDAKADMPTGWVDADTGEKLKKQALV